MRFAERRRRSSCADRMRQDAIIHKLEIVGEAVKQLSEETKRRRPEVPWKQIAGMRDRLTHGYFGVDLGCCGESSSGISNLSARPPPPC
ncbi:MAG: HepT-like ribonuclease domain-containing protein [Vicinamibacterales bacterium]